MEEKKSEPNEDDLIEIPDEETDDKDDSVEKNLRNSENSEEDSDNSNNLDQKIDNFDSQDIQEELMNFAELDDLGDFTEDDLQDMQEAIAENKAHDLEIGSFNENESVSKENEAIRDNSESEFVQEFKPEIDKELEAKMQEEIEKKKRDQGEKTVSKEEFIQYLSERRTKIVYHALWYLAFNCEDHYASKLALYDALKEVTSKNAVEPLEEHKFYFGLGFILRLKLFDQKVVQFKDGKIKVMVNVSNLQEILKIIGDPISERPIMTTSEKKDMFKDFLNDEFLDI